MELKGKKVLLTGASGFVGRYMVKSLHDIGAEVITASHRSFDLREQDEVDGLLESESPEVVIHLAASVGGIGANQKNPGKFFYDNLMMGVNLIHSSMLCDVKKFVQIGTVCSYPKFCQIPFIEQDLWEGYPEETNAPYGIAKKALLTMLQAYREQYGLNGIYLIPVNMYGPGDNFDLETSHVIPALIRKFVEAKAKGLKEVTVWGTGNAYREFIHVRDAVTGIIKATENYEGSDPVNLGTGRDVSIKQLANLICDLVGFEGDIVFDEGKPDGQPKRRLSTTMAKKFGFEAKIPLVWGLKETIDSYYESLNNDK